MNSAALERWFRRFLLILVELMCIGTVFELYLAKHYKETDQLIPFGLCIAAFLSVLVVLIRPQLAMIWLLRVVMVVVILGSLLGGMLHLNANLEFVTEMRPTISTIDGLLTALSGAAPLLAPGVLGLAGVLALAATYYHPALGKRSEA
jgi:hypothetical protein